MGTSQHNKSKKKHSSALLKYLGGYTRNKNTPDKDLSKAKLAAKFEKQVIIAATQKVVPLEELVREFAIDMLPPEKLAEAKQLFPNEFYIKNYDELENILLTQKEVLEDIANRENIIDTGNDYTAYRINKLFENGIIDKTKYTPDEAAYVYEHLPATKITKTQMGLGVIEQLIGLPFIKKNIEYFSAHPQNLADSLLHFYRKEGEQTYNGKLEEFVKQTREKLNRFEMDKIITTEGTIADVVISKLEKYVEFSHHLNNDADLKLFLHQITPIYHLTHNGLKRILCAYGTGAGKTVIPIATKLYLDKEKEKKHTAMIITPGQTMNSVWSNEELNRYAKRLGFSEDVKSIIIDSQKTINHINPKDYDFIIINYDKLGITDDDEHENKYLKKILEWTDDIDMTIYDEVHRTKNHSSNTAQAISKITERTANKHAILLTATPAHTKIKDLGFQFYLLNPFEERFRKYKDEPYIYRDDKNAIRDLSHRGQFLDFSKEYVSELFKLPKMIESEIHMTFNETERQEYFNIWEPARKIGEKFVPLRRTLLKSKVRQLDGIIDASITHAKENIGEDISNAQVIVYTPLRTGIIGDTETMKGLKTQLEERYGIGKVCVITGEITDFNEKVRLAEAFRRGEYRAMVCTNVLSEGINLSCGDKPINMILLEPPLTPGIHDQLVGRIHRDGQRAKVYVNKIIMKDEELRKQLLYAARNTLPEQYNVKFDETFSGMSIDEDISYIVKERREFYERIIKKALFISDKEFNKLEFDGLRIDDHGNILTRSMGHTIPQQKKVKSEFNKNITTGRNFRGLHYNEKNIEDSIYNAYKDYEGWKTSHAAESNRTVADIISTLEQQNHQSYTTIADLGSGPAAMALIFNEKEQERFVHAVDGSKKMLELGEDYCALNGIEDYALHHKPLDNTGIATASVDVVTINNALHYNAQTGKQDERDIEKIILESRRILKDEGYLITTLIKQNSSTENTHKIKQYEKILQAYGFEVCANPLPAENLTIIGRKQSQGPHSLEEVTQQFSMYIAQKYKAFGATKEMNTD